MSLRHTIEIGKMMWIKEPIKFNKVFEELKVKGGELRRINQGETRERMAKKKRRLGRLGGRLV